MIAPTWSCQALPLRAVPHRRRSLGGTRPSCIACITDFAAAVAAGLLHSCQALLLRNAGVAALLDASCWGCCWWRRGACCCGLPAIARAAWTAQPLHGTAPGMGAHTPQLHPQCLAATPGVAPLPDRMSVALSTLSSAAWSVRLLLRQAAGGCRTANVQATTHDRHVQSLLVHVVDSVPYSSLWCWCCWHRCCC